MTVIFTRVVFANVWGGDFNSNDKFFLVYPCPTPKNLRLFFGIFLTLSMYLEWSSLENYHRNVSPHFWVHLTPQRSSQMSPKSACKPSICPTSTKRGASLLQTKDRKKRKRTLPVRFEDMYCKWDSYMWQVPFYPKLEKTLQGRRGSSVAQLMIHFTLELASARRLSLIGWFQVMSSWK